MIDQNIRELIRNEIKTVLNKTDLKLNSEKKPDGSWVTDVDHEITRRVESLLSHYFPGVNIVSEEGSHEIEFPCFVLDPVDGTAGLVRGTGECSLSLAYMPNSDITDPLATGYIAHLFSDFEVHSEMLQAYDSNMPELGLVSRSEWNKGLFEGLMDRNIKPLGSIALKLAYMVSGEASFVATLQPKSIWDIAAGTILLHKSGANFWHHGQKVSNLAQKKFDGPMVWGTRQDAVWASGK